MDKRKRGMTMGSKTSFRVLKNEAGKIIGGEISGDGSQETKEYCATFLKALSEDSANIVFKDSSIVFIRNDGNLPETYSHELSDEEFAALKAIITPKNKALKFEPSWGWCGNLKLFIE